MNRSSKTALAVKTILANLVLLGCGVLLFCQKSASDNPTNTNSIVPAATQSLPGSPIEEWETSEAPEDTGKSPSEDLETTAFAPVERADSEYQAGTVQDVQLVRVFADVFKTQDPSVQVMAYHLGRAVLSGKDITFDQIHRNGVEVRRLIETILYNNIQPDPIIERNLSTYLKLLWIHCGFYDRVTGRKIVAPFSFEELDRVARSANAGGADLGLTQEESLEAKLSRLKRVLFDPNHQTQLVPRWPNLEGDLLSSSNINLYSGATQRALIGYKASFGRNSRLSWLDGKWVEEIYRSGDQRRKIAPGRYAHELRQVIRRLQEAVPQAERMGRRVMDTLVETFRTGDPAAFEDAVRAWSSTILGVEFFIGFLDYSLDPMGDKGVYQGWMGIPDGPNSAKIESILRNIQYFEDQLPWDAGQRRHWSNPPKAVAVNLLTAAGWWDSLSDYSFRILQDKASGEMASSKIVLFSNVLEAHHHAVDLPLVREFVSPASRDIVLKRLEQFNQARIMLREVLGKNMGQEDKNAATLLRGILEPLQALKAELVALWLLADPKLVELGMLPGKDAATAAYTFVMSQALTAEALDRSETLRPSSMALRILARYMVEKAKVTVWEEKDQRIYPRVKDPEEFRSALAALLVRVEKILTQGNRQSGLRLLKNYGTPAKWPGLDNAAARAKVMGLRRLVTYVMPKLVAQRGASGSVDAVSISQDETFDRQIMRFRKY